MFANFFKNLIVKSFGNYIEDFTSDDIVIDKWNGQVVKDNVTVKKLALENLFMSAFGAPVTVVKGYIRKLRIDVPWNKLLSKPCEIYLEDVHVVVTASAEFDKEFAKRMVRKIKMGEFEEIKAQIQKQRASKELLEEGKSTTAVVTEKESYMSRLSRIIEENLRLIVTNLHIRFEDNGVSRVDSQFNFGIMFDTLNYSVTNNNFERVFINIDNKKQEQKAYSMLEVKQLAVYWNSNAPENWTRNKEFMGATAPKLIDLSRRYTESLKKRYQQYLSNLSTSSVFLVQPCNIRLRIRKNLSPHTLTELPKSTSALDVTDICITIDEEVYKDVQYLMKFFSWHKTAVIHTPHFKFRPPYNLSVKSNGIAYFKYAVKAIQYQLKKQKKEVYLKQKRNQETLELSYLNMMEMVNENYEKIGFQQRLLSTIMPSSNGDLTIKFDSVDLLQNRIMHLQTKLTPEQMIMGYMKAEKMAAEFIAKEAEKAGWRSWLPGMIKSSFLKDSLKEQSAMGSVDSFSDADFDNMMQRYQETIPDDKELPTEEETKSSFSGTHDSIQGKSSIFKDRLLSHFSVSVPKLDIAFMSKKFSNYNKYFMLLTIQGIYYQTVTSQHEKFKLFEVKNLELIDKVTERLKFSKAIMKKEVADVPSQKSNYRLKKGKMMSQQIESHMEIEEEAKANVNNGLPMIREFDQILATNAHQFFLVQIVNKSTFKKGEKCNEYKIDIYLSAIQVFYNRTLISRAQTFINQATINKVQNAAAEAEFDQRIQNIKDQTQEKMNRILERSEIQLNCNAKGIEILIPDSTNYEASKFLSIQTGDLFIKNGLHQGQSFTMRKPFNEFIGSHHPQFSKSLQNLPQTDDYSLTLNDFSILYIPNLQHLENLPHLEDLSKYTFLKRTDFFLDYKTNKDANLTVVSASLSSFDISLTNKEVKELKNFMDNTKKYHEQIAMEVLRELQQLQMTNYQIQQFDEQFDRMQSQQIDEEEDGIGELPNINVEELKSSGSRLKSQRSGNQLSHFLSVATKSFRKNSGSLNSDNLNYMSVNSKDFKDFENDSNRERSLSKNESAEDDDEFFDAQDVFDQEIIQMLKAEEALKQQQQETEINVQKHKFIEDKKIVMEFYIKRFKLNILEAANLQQDLVQGLRQRLGSFGNEQIDFEIQYKGIPFLRLEISKIGMCFMQVKSEKVIVCTLRDFNLIHFEKPGVHTSLIRSSNAEIDDFFGDQEISQPVQKQKPKYRDLEDEDLIQAEAQMDENLNDFFVRFIFHSRSHEEVSVKKSILQVAMIEIDLNETVLLKIMEALILDFPFSPQHYQPVHHNQPNLLNQEATLTLNWDGAKINISVKKDLTEIMIGQIIFWHALGINGKKSIDFQLDDFRLSQNQSELILKCQSIDSLDDNLLHIKRNHSSTDIAITQLLMIAEIKQIVTLHNSITKLKKIASMRKQQPNQQQQRNLPNEQQSNQGQQQLKITINEAYLQVPVKENKNSMYIKFSNVQLDKISETDQSAAQFHQLLIFVAKSISQQTQYKFINLEACKLVKKQGLMFVDLESFYLTLNENYIVLIAGILEQHLEDSIALIQKFKTNEQEQVIEPQVEEQIEVVQTNIIPKEVSEEYFNTIYNCYSLKRFKQEIESYTKIICLRCGLFGLQWVFDQSFDDHEDNYVTLFNKNFSQQILSQFDLKQDLQEEFINTSSKAEDHNFQSQHHLKHQMLAGSQYEVLNFEITEIVYNGLDYKEIQKDFKIVAFQCKDLILKSIDKHDKPSTLIQISHEGLDTQEDESFAVEFLNENRQYDELSVSLIEAFVNNRNCKIISNLAKSVYSCKNILKRGKKREFFKNYVKKQKNLAQELSRRKNKSKFDITVFKVKAYVSQEQLSASKSSDQDGSQNVFVRNLQSSISAQQPHQNSESNTQIVFEGNIRIFQLKDNVVEQLMDADINKFKVSLTDLSLFIEPKVRGDILSTDNFFSDKVILVHPFSAMIKVKTISTDKKKMMIDVMLPLLEIEFSMKQVFHIRHILDQIVLECQPLLTMIKHMKQSQGKTSKKDLKNQQILDETIFRAMMYQLYFTVVKESGDPSIDSNICIPLFSLEFKNFNVEFTKSEQNNKVSIVSQIPLQLYYFNTKLNFYEPLIEYTNIGLIFEHEKLRNDKQIKLQNVGTMNINFSVALYDSIFSLMHTLTEEKDKYLRVKSGENHSNEGDFTKRNGSGNINFNPSSFYIKNSTGELLLFKTGRQPAFTELQVDDHDELKFEFEEPKQSKHIITEEDQSPSRSNMSGNEDDEDGLIEEEVDATTGARSKENKIKPVSKYRRENLRYMRGQPKKVYFQILIGNNDKGSHQGDRTSVFEVNLDSLTCQRFYLDDQRKLYVICQAQTKNGIKHLLVRSPMQITNNLQIPMEVQLIHLSKNNLSSSSSLLIRSGIEEEFKSSLIMEEASESRFYQRHDITIKPESSVMIPLKACGFNQVKMRPLLSQPNGHSIHKDSIFEWTSTVDMSLQQDDREIFERKPVVMVSKIAHNKDSQQKYNNRLFFMLNANVYSIRRNLDFNTSQTEYISMKYLSISPPFVIQNLLPVTLLMMIKNVARDSDSQKKDPREYKLEMKMNSSIQSLFLNPFGNFDMSLCIPGFENSSFVPLKVEGDDDFELPEQNEQEPFIQSMFESELAPLENVQFKPSNSDFKNKFRFLRQKKILFQMTSKYQNQFNVCANFAFIQGYYHISFFAKYWFLNNTQMPLQMQMITDSFAFEKYELPYEQTDFDFDTIKKFIKNDDAQHGFPNKKGEVSERKQSIDSFQTETLKESKSHQKSITSHSNLKEANIDELNYKQLFDTLQSSNKDKDFIRVKPWEYYKMLKDKEDGFIGALSQQDIDQVSTIYMAQMQQKEEQEEEAEEVQPASKSVKGVRFKEEVKEEAFMRFEKNTIMSKNTIQMADYQQISEKNSLLQLNQLNISRFNLFETPLTDKDHVKRVVLFSDNPLDDQIQKDQRISIKICDSEWSATNFDITQLQRNPIFIHDNPRGEGQPTSLYEIVVQVQYMPYPFSFSKIITFQPRYVFVNKTCMNLYVIQSGCEEKGQFKVYPMETSIFHWTDSKKRCEVSVKLESYEFSGNFKINQIGEINLRLRSSVDHECLILNAQINEENNAFFIVVSDMSFAPPYRIENMTKTTFKISQKDSRSDDFELLKPFQITSFAWSYPMNEKLLSIAICTQSQDEHIGVYNIDTINKTENISFKSKKTNKEYTLMIINEKTIKVIRILYAQNAQNQQELIDTKKDQIGKRQESRTIRFALQKLGLSIVSSQAREIAYIQFTDFKFKHHKTRNNIKLTLKLDQVQIDNQLVRQNDAIILKRQQDETMKFLTLKLDYVNNEAIENFHHFKLFFLELAPFDLNLDGNFCDEIYKYILDVMSNSKKMKSQQSLGPINIYEKTETDALKFSLDDLKKPYFKKDSSQIQKKILFEQFYIHDIKLNFTFQSSPILFREFAMHPAMKFLIVLLTNLKNVNLSFNKYQPFQYLHQQILMPVFIAQMKKVYLQQCYSNTQFLRIVGSMGIFGNVTESVNSFSNAFTQFQNRPSLFATGQVFKESFLMVAVPLKSSFVNLFKSIGHFMNQNQAVNEEDASQSSLTNANDASNDKDLFEDEITQSNREINNFSSPLLMIDRQNKIWVKIISREKLNQDEKKRQLLKSKEDNGLAGSLQQPNFDEFYKRNRGNQNQAFPVMVASSMFKFVKAVPVSIINNADKLFEQKKHKTATKVRPPRFVSFRMELEPYNEQKAIALQVLNDINLDVFVAETIEKVFTFKRNSLILTGKRLICVQTNDRKEKTSWNILYRDIMKITVLIFDKESQVNLSKDELMEIIDKLKEGDEDNIYFIMKILYHELDEGTAVQESDSEQLGHHKRLMRSNNKNLTSSFAFDDLGSLRVGEKQIEAKLNEENKMLRFYRTLQQRTDQKMIK